MGSLAIAKCQCGLETNCSLGGGLRDHLVRCNFPCYCPDCKSLYTGNLFNKPETCAQCRRHNGIAYDDPMLRGLPPEQEPPVTYEKQSLLDKLLRKEPKPIPYCRNKEKDIFNWSTEHQLGREIYLTYESYLCPSCQKLTLHFDFVGVFD